MAAIIPGLPPEVADMTPSYTNELSRYAGINKAWKHCVERRTFAVLHLRAERFMDAVAIVTHERQAFVRTIQLDIILNQYVQTDREAGANDERLTQCVTSLFSFLSSWRPQNLAANGIDLTILVYSPTDLSVCNHQRRRWEKPGLGFVPLDLGAGRYCYDSLILIAQQALGRVSFVRSLVVGPGRSSRIIHVTALVPILAALPGLESFHLRAGAHRSLRCKHQREVYISLLDALPRSTKTFRFDLYDDTLHILRKGGFTVRAARKLLTDITRTVSGFILHDGQGFLSTALRRSTSQLSSLHLVGVFGTELFRYKRGAPFVEWLSDETIRTLSAGVPRYSINHSTMDDWYSAIAGALPGMPQLEGLYATLMVNGLTVQHFTYKAGRSGALVIWDTKPVYTPDAWVLAQWEAAVKAQGRPLEIFCFQIP